VRKDRTNAAYDRDEMLADRRKIIELWGKFLRGYDAYNLVEMKRGAA
jgi:hypothetical protein